MLRKLIGVFVLEFNALLLFGLYNLYMIESSLAKGLGELAGKQLQISVPFYILATLLILTASVFTVYYAFFACPREEKTHRLLLNICDAMSSPSGKPLREQIKDYKQKTGAYGLPVVD